MKTAIIVHGMPSKKEFFSKPNYRASEQQWVPWITEQLRNYGIEVHNPEMPVPYQPVYEKWSAVFETYPINEETILVGHSCGAGFLVRWLSEHKVKVGKVVLVAPWIDPKHKDAPHMFNELKIDNNIAERTAGLTEFISLDDDQEELTTLEILKSKIKGLQVKEFTDKGHFVIESMKTNEFPELLNFLIQ